MSKPFKLPIQKIANILLDENRSMYRRAIELYGLQALVLSPESLHTGLDAKIFAAIKVLEFLDENLPEDTPLKEKLKTPHYAETLELATWHGWNKIRNLGTAKAFANDLDLRKKQSLAVAEMAEFSYRYSLFEKTARKLGGSTMARQFLERTARKRVGYSDGTLKTRWTDYKNSAALLYLFHRHTPDLFPNRVSSTGFLESLLLQTHDYERLRFLFAAYRDISRELRNRGYDCEKISLPQLRNFTPSIPISDFTAADRAVFPDM